MDYGDKKAGSKSPFFSLRGKTKSIVPSSPLARSIQSPDNENSRAPDGTVRQNYGRDIALEDDLLPLPASSLSYDAVEKELSQRDSRPQEPIPDGKVYGTGVVLSTPHRHGQSVSGTNVGPAAATPARSGHNPSQQGGTSSSHGRQSSNGPLEPRGLGSAPPTAPSTLTTRVSRTPMLDTSAADEPQSTGRTKGMLSGLTRKSSTFLKRARGSNKQEEQLKLVTACPTGLAPPIVPSSPLVNSTLSPLSPRAPLGSAASSPSMGPLPKAASIASLSMGPDLNTMPGSPRIGLKSPGLLGSPRSKKKSVDELMAAFSLLDKDHERFHSRKVVLKANIVRDNVIIFLRTWKSHPLNTSMTPEDLEIRCQILSRWWSTLLDMLKELHNDRISGHDRPIVLEALTGIMERPEWRIAVRDTSSTDKLPSPARRKTSSISGDSSSRSSISIASTSGIARAETGKDLFEKNLSAQMAIVVEKMSQRTTPSSLVSFCGKACAYAYFFSPGMANILSRLWGVSPARLKRVLKAFDFEAPFRFQGEADAMLPYFPSCLHPLSFTSLRTATTRLRCADSIPEQVKHVNWRGYWLKRWSGKDSDLFYAFVKQYHKILADILPGNLLKTEWICGPGVLLVYGQILANLDMTIHRLTPKRASSPEKGDKTPREPAAITFDDVLGADASANTFDSVSINASKQIADNRLVSLLNDMLPLRAEVYPASAYLFADGFADILKAAALHTSAYDQAACYTLCDFLQEALVILTKFEKATSSPALIDWDFWIKVFTQLAHSVDTVTQMRLYTLLYAIWPLVSGNASWREQFCINVLLDPGYFDAHFSNFCPMLRNYYHRLLCWRIARCDTGNASDMRTLRIVHERLLHVDRQFRTLQHDIHSAGKMKLEVEPCTPAPYRRFLIIRTDIMPSPTALALEGFVPHAPASTVSMNLPPPMIDDEDAIDLKQLTDKLNQTNIDPERSSKRGGLLRSIMGSRSPQVGSPKISSRPDSQSRTPSTPASREASPQASPSMSPRKSIHQQRPTAPGRTGSFGGPGRQSHEQATTGSGFKEAYFRFSLEAVDKHRGGMPREYHKFPPHLPGQYQSLLDQRPDIRVSEDNGVSAITTSTQKPAQSSRYAGMALAEWYLVVNECQNFFERRRREGVPSNALVETPALYVESMKRAAA